MKYDDSVDCRLILGPKYVSWIFLRFCMQIQFVTSKNISKFANVL